MRIPFEELAGVNRPFEGGLRRAFEEVLASGRYLGGAQGEALEGEVAALLGVPRAAGVGSGSDALALALLGLGLGEGEVVVPANAHPADGLAVARAGLTPVFCDPHPGTWLMDPAGVERCLTPRTVAILPVHLFGLPCPMEGLMALAARRGLAVVEDCAQAMGARWGGRAVGSFGDAAAFSFYPTKNLGGLGDGGMVAVRDPAAAERIRSLRADGFSSRLDELQAAFLRVKLPRLGGMIEGKNRLAALYQASLPPDLERPSPCPGAEPARHLFPVLPPAREPLREGLRERGIGTGVHFPLPLHRHPALRRFPAGPLPVAERLCSRTLSLPLSLALAEEDVLEVAREVTALIP